MRLGVLTSVDTRHRYFANVLRSHFDVVAIGYEKTGYAHAEVDMGDLTRDEIKIVTHHFAERIRQEELFFGANSDFAVNDETCRVWQLARGTLNTPETMAFFDDQGVDTVAVFGTNLIKPPLLTRWPGRLINMHLGLSPYYRGTATNFYPLLNEEPQYVGATIHVLDEGIDSGPILRHARPEIVADDRPHTIGCKAIQAGIDALVSVLQNLDAGRAAPVRQWEVPNPRLYLRKDYHPQQVVELYRKIEGGLIPQYVMSAEENGDDLRLVGEVAPSHAR